MDGWMGFSISGPHTPVTFQVKCPPRGHMAKESRNFSDGLGLAYKTAKYNKRARSGPTDS